MDEQISESITLFDSFDTRRIYKPEFPFLLKQTPGQPKWLEVAGDIPGDEYKFLCVVGSRQNSDYGSEMCRKIISELRGRSVCIVSGMAIGIDSISHEAAINAGLRTMAFPGSGLHPEVLYPPQHVGLAKRILESGGCLVSPFDHYKTGGDWTFPRRNVLMAGVSHAVLIIEGAQHSGTLLTAKYAENFHRDIFCVPGDIYRDRSYGPNMLIRKGAALIRSGRDVLETLGFDPDLRKIPLEQMTLTDEQTRIIAELQREPGTASELVEKTGMVMTIVNVTLGTLEINGLIAEKDGKFKMNH